MALAVEKGVLTVPGTTGNQTVTLVDTGFGDVKAVILWGTYDTAEGDNAGDLVLCSGFGTYRGSVAQQWVQAMFSRDGATTTDSVRGTSTSSILRGFSDGTPTVDFDAALVSLGDASFVINWTDLPGTASLKFHYLALGGTDITDALAGTATATNGTGELDISVTAGFGQPDLIFVLGGNNTTGGDQAAPAPFSFGAGIDDSNQRGVAFLNEENTANVELASVQGADMLRVLRVDTAYFIDAALGATATWPTDGYSINRNSAPGGDAIYGHLLLKGSFTAVVGSTTVPTSIGTQDLAVGATPRGAIFFTTGLPTAAGIVNTGTDLGMICLGGMDGTSEGSSVVGDDDGATQSATHRHHSESKAIRMFTPSPSGTLATEADASFSTTNVRLTWTSVDTDSREFSYVLLGDGSTGGDTLTAGGAVAQGNTLAPAAAATVGGATAAGTSASAAATATQGGAVAAGTSPTAQAALTAGGAVAAGRTFGDTDTLTPGGAVAAGNTLSVSVAAQAGAAQAQGNTIASSVPVTGGSANAQGNTLTPALAQLTAGGAIAGGNTITEEGDTLISGGAVAQGNALSAAAAAVIGGALAQGNTVAAAVPITGGSANAQGNQPSPAVALLTIGGAIAAGNILVEGADVVTGRFDRPTPAGSAGGTPDAGAFDRPTPGVTV